MVQCLGVCVGGGGGATRGGKLFDHWFALLACIGMKPWMEITCGGVEMRGVVWPDGG